MKKLILVLGVLVASVGGCAIVPLDPGYRGDHHYYRGDGYYRGDRYYHGDYRGDYYYRRYSYQDHGQ